MKRKKISPLLALAGSISDADSELMLTTIKNDKVNKSDEIKLLNLVVKINGFMKK